MIKTSGKLLFSLLIINQYYTSKAFLLRTLQKLRQGCFITNYHLKIQNTCYLKIVWPSVLEKRLTRFEVIDNVVGSKPVRG